MIIQWGATGNSLNASMGFLISWDSVFGGGSAPGGAYSIFMNPMSHVWGPL